jgi:hypothetical protein
MHPNSLVNSICAGLSRWIVGSDDESLVTGSVEMLEHPEHRVADTIDMREERFCDDGNAHTLTVAALIVAKVADGHTGREISWSTSYELAEGRC